MTYYVTEKETCWTCKGRGVVQHPAWAKYFQDNASTFQNMTHEDDRKWFDDELGYVKPPPEEEQCVECDGRGIIVREIELGEALDMLGVRP